MPSLDLQQDQSPVRAAQQQDDASASVLAAVVDSFYPELVQSGRLAKERAQQMLSAVTVLSAALIAALVAGSANVASAGAKVAAIVAVVGWVIASGVLAWAATPKKSPTFERDLTAPELVRTVITESATMERVVESRLRYATVVTVGALAITLGSFVVYLFGIDTADWRAADIAFAPGVGVPALCGSEQPVDTRIDASTLTRDTVHIRVACRDGSENDWSVSRTAVTAVRNR